MTAKEPAWIPHRIHGLSTCDVCGKAVQRVARLGEQWACAEHFPTMPCERCGEEAKPVGVERFMISSADGAAYALGQNVGYRCAARHLSHSEPHMGPGWDGWKEQR